MALSLGLVCFLAVKILVSAFYARQNTKFPVKVAIVAMLVNVVLNALLIGPLAHAGLALASTLSSMLNVTVLLVVLLRQKIYIPLEGWATFSLRILLANVLMGAILWWFVPEMAEWLDWSASARAINLTMFMSAAALAYFGSLFLTGLRINHLKLQSV